MYITIQLWNLQSTTTFPDSRVCIRYYCIMPEVDQGARKIFYF